MLVDYSTFERPYSWDNWYGKVTLSDGRDERTVRIEIGTDEDFIPEESKRMLEYFITHYADYKAALLEPIYDYYYFCRSNWGTVPPDDPRFPEITDINKINEMITLSSVYIHDPETRGRGSIGLLFECTWEKEEGMGICMQGYEVEKIGIQETHY